MSEEKEQVNLRLSQTGRSAVKEEDQNSVLNNDSFDSNMDLSDSTEFGKGVNQNDDLGYDDDCNSVGKYFDGEDVESELYKQPPSVNTAGNRSDFEISDVMALLRKMDSDNQSLNGTVSELNKKLDSTKIDLKSDINNLKGDINDLKGNYQDLNSKLDNKFDSVSRDLKITNDTLASNCDRFDKLLVDTNDKVKDLTNKVTNIEAEVQNIKTACEQSLENRVGPIEKRLDGHASNLNDLGSKVVQVQTNLNASCNEIFPKLSVLETELCETKGKLSKVEQSNQECSSALHSAEIKITALELHQQTLEKTILIDRQALKEDFEFLKLCKDENQNSLTSIGSRMAMVEGKIEGMNSDMSKLAKGTMPVVAQVENLKTEPKPQFEERMFGPELNHPQKTSIYPNKSVLRDNNDVNFSSLASQPKNTDVYSPAKVQFQSHSPANLPSCMSQNRPPSFGDKYNMNPVVFISEMEHYFETHHIVPEYRIPVVKMSLNGEARTWFRRLRSPCYSWSDFKNAFLNRYFNNKIRATQYAAATTRKQGSKESCVSFASDVIEQVSVVYDHLGELETGIVPLIFHNMLPEFIRFVGAGEIESFSQLIEMAGKFDNRSPLFAFSGNTSRSANNNKPFKPNSNFSQVNFNPATVYPSFNPGNPVSVNLPDTTIPPPRMNFTAVQSIDGSRQSGAGNQCLGGSNKRNDILYSVGTPYDPRKRKKD